jgi:hypothetical protein
VVNGEDNIFPVPVTAPFGFFIAIIASLISDHTLKILLLLIFQQEGVRLGCSNPTALCRSETHTGNTAQRPCLLGYYCRQDQRLFMSGLSSFSDMWGEFWCCHKSRVLMPGLHSKQASQSAGLRVRRDMTMHASRMLVPARQEVRIRFGYWARHSLFAGGQAYWWDCFPRRARIPWWFIQQTFLIFGIE